MDNTIKKLAELERRWEGISRVLIPYTERRQMNALRLELFMREGGYGDVKRRALATAYQLLDTYLLLSREDDLTLTELPEADDYYYAAQNVLEYLDLPEKEVEKFVEM